jgi:hypothetical protein
MVFEDIRSSISDICADRYMINDDSGFGKELMGLADSINHKWIYRIKRAGIETSGWKTLVFVEIIEEEQENIKLELKRAINWAALVKEALSGEENVDLYLFLAFNDTINEEECYRIESTEQICRKYVLRPGEDVSGFLTRTFLQKLTQSVGSIEAEDPVERAFSKTVQKHAWLTPELQKAWRKAFADLSGSDLSEAILRKGSLL